MVRDSVFGSNPPECEVAILFSNDTPFRAAVHKMLRPESRTRFQSKSRGGVIRRHVSGPIHSTVVGVKLRQHRTLDHAFYKSVEDTTSYG